MMDRSERIALDRWITREPDEETYIQIGEGRHKAAKEYKCEDCGKPIQKGEVYYRTAFKHEDEVFARRTHASCDWS